MKTDFEEHELNWKQSNLGIFFFFKDHLVHNSQQADLGFVIAETVKKLLIFL